jgi:hypothetical protein
MLKLITLAGALFAADPAPISGEDAVADLALAREALERIHPGYGRYGNSDRLDAMWSAAADRAANGATPDALYLDLSLILAEIRCDHTKAELPDALETARQEDPVYLPFRFTLIDGRMIVEDAGQTPLDRGEEILSLDGDPAANRLAAILPFMPVDGFTDHVKLLEIADSSEFMGSGFDHFDPLLNPDDGQVVVEVRGLDGAVRTETPDRVSYPRFLEIGSDGRRYRNFSDPDMIEMAYVAPGVARLAVNTFVNYRTPVDPAERYAPYFDQLAADGAHTLILDLRRNGGGSTDAQQGLLAQLIERPAMPAREVLVRTYDYDGLREHLTTWNVAALQPDPAWFTERPDGFYTLAGAISGGGALVEPAENAFRGRIVVLTGPQNSSGAASIIGALREEGRAILVGEPPAAAQVGPTAGQIFFLDLPGSGIRVRVAVMWTIQNVTDAQDGYGFQPDVMATVTYEAWLAGRDPALEAAIAQAVR